MIESRDRFATERENKNTLWELKRPEINADRQQREADRNLSRVASTAERAVEAAFETPAAAIGKAARKTGRAVGLVGKLVEGTLGLLFGPFMAPPKDTKAQAEQKVKAATNEETLHAEAYAAQVEAKEAEFDDRMHAQKTAQQEQDLSFAARFGTPPTREANIGRENDHERERERD